MGVRERESDRASVWRVCVCVRKPDAQRGARERREREARERGARERREREAREKHAAGVVCGGSKRECE
jgi:hypothetical protein